MQKLSAAIRHEPSPESQSPIATISSVGHTRKKLASKNSQIFPLQIRMIHPMLSSQMSANHDRGGYSPEGAWNPKKIAKRFLLQHEPAFKRLMELREKVILFPENIVENNTKDSRNLVTSHNPSNDYRASHNAASH